MAVEWVRAKEVVWQELDGEAVLVSAAADRSWHLNSTAAFVWKHLDGRTSIEVIIQRLAGAGGRELSRITADVKNLCAQFESEGLVKTACAAASRMPSACFQGSYLPPMLRMAQGVTHRGKIRPRGVSF